MLRGWRRYHIMDAGGGNYMLKGLFGQEWETAEKTAECLCDDFFRMDSREARQAECRRQLAFRPLDYSSDEHGCGIYFVPEHSDLDKVVHDMGGVDVAVIAWGVTAQYEKGYKAEFVRIDAILIPPPWCYRRNVEEIAAALRIRYGVSVDIDPSLPSIEHDYEGLD